MLKWILMIGCVQWIKTKRHVLLKGLRFFKNSLCFMNIDELLKIQYPFELGTIIIKIEIEIKVSLFGLIRNEILWSDKDNDKKFLEEYPCVIWFNVKWPSLNYPHVK